VECAVGVDASSPSGGSWSSIVPGSCTPGGGGGGVVLHLVGLGLGWGGVGWVGGSNAPSWGGAGVSGLGGAGQLLSLAAARAHQGGVWGGRGCGGGDVLEKVHPVFCEQ
jgi:hypothetical protein